MSIDLAYLSQGKASILICLTETKMRRAYNSLNIQLKKQGKCSEDRTGQGSELTSNDFFKKYCPRNDSGHPRVLNEAFQHVNL